MILPTENHEHHEDDDHDHHNHHHGHTHTHGIVDPSILTTEQGIRVVKWSFAGLFVTASIQVIIVYYSGSIALLADTIHNFGDALTAIPLLFAFMLAKWKPTKRFTYGYGRVEDLAGVFVVLMILVSALVAGYVSIDRLFHPQEVTFLWAVAAAAIVGFIGNEGVAQLRIRVGKEIGSAALIADGYHARTDGWTSLAVLIGATGVYLGFPLADPVIGLIITVMIFWIVWDSAKMIFTRLLDGVDPAVTDEIRHTAGHVKGVVEITEVRIRWLGHRLHAEINITVGSSLSVESGHAIAKEFRHELLHHLRYLSDATIHVDPVSASGQDYHHIAEHDHDGLPVHSH
ncbi:MAG: cation diffusion facilitator family transporter [Methanoregula sp.]|jgi:cation diffusion facilitator family transporter|uniref:cation diffusion facilitator family transporter n=1 Tax=Methanoregula sp. TaxID=2052170 RepID=UPI0025D68EC9|nr:cation diffusion facilitator family transporter [Methanoregula sp.]MCK9630443.1 cation diffusion facilitator family transporter [Methanoregula sp.]